MSFMGDTRYCLCCDEEVSYNVLERHDNRELTCVFCGFTLDVQQAPGAAPARGGCILIAEDSNFTRKIMRELIIEKELASDVMGFEDGLELITAYSGLLAEKRAIDLAIIDLNMPVMDGFTAARGVRALEIQHKSEKVPIVFFSAVKADENLKKQMTAFDPAGYVNKGSDPDPEKLVARVEYLMGYLADRYGRGSR
jgi:CheY-like chemotaxis protein